MLAMRLVLTVLLLTATNACDAPRAVDGNALTLGGVEVSAQVLQHGERVYRQRCLICHGEGGAGDGPMGPKLSPKASDLRRGQYAHAPDPNALPSDAYFHQLLTQGIPNTGMQAWDMERDDRHAVIQHIKTLSPRWRTQ